MTHARRSRRPPRIRSVVAAIVAAVGIVAGVALPGPTSRSADAVEPTEAAAPPQQPSIQYEESQAHAADRPDLVPGDRVTVPFVPRASDRATVGGRPPQALPAGRASGVAMAASEQGTGLVDVGAPLSDVQATGEPAAGTDAAAAQAAVSQTSVSGLRKEVFGFLPYWELNDSSTTLDYDVLSTLAFFGVGADRYGNLLKQSGGTTTVGWSGWTSSRLSGIIDAAHRRGTRVVLTVQMFAWTTGQKTNQAAFLDSPTARLTLARQAAAAVRDRGADGINLDFEPIVSGRADEFTAFVRTLRAELDKLAKGYQLTFDATGWIGNYPIEDATAAGAADAVLIMGYDYRGSSASTAGSVAPLGGPAYDIGDTLDAYLDRVPREQGHPRGAVLRSGMVDGLGCPARRDPDRVEVRLLELRRVRHRGRSHRPVRTSL